MPQRSVAAEIGTPTQMVLSIVLGLVLLFAGAEFLVRGSVSVAHRLGISPLTIGLTLVGFGTSTPELVTSLEAAFRESPGIAVGNVVGSNIANILLILGAAALISPIACNPRAFRRDAAMVLGSAVLLAICTIAGAIGPVIGSAFVVLLLAYVGLTYIRERRIGEISPKPAETGMAPADSSPYSLAAALAFAASGIAMTIGGAYLLVDGAIALATAAGVSDTVIGLTVVAVGTSLPELSTSVIAAFRKQGDIALGNILGSNLYNILGILGLTAIVHPLTIPAEIARVDIWVMLAATVLLIVFALTGRRLSRGEGAVFLFLYAAYTGHLALSAAP